MKALKTITLVLILLMSLNGCGKETETSESDNHSTNHAASTSMTETETTSEVIDDVKEEEETEEIRCDNAWLDCIDSNSIHVTVIGPADETYFPTVLFYLDGSLAEEIKCPQTGQYDLDGSGHISFPVSFNYRLLIGDDHSRHTVQVKLRDRLCAREKLIWEEKAFLLPDTKLCPKELEITHWNNYETVADETGWRHPEGMEFWFVSKRPGRAAYHLVYRDTKGNEREGVAVSFGSGIYNARLPHCGNTECAFPRLVLANGKTSVIDLAK